MLLCGTDVGPADTGVSVGTGVRGIDVGVDGGRVSVGDTDDSVDARGVAVGDGPGLQLFEVSARKAARRHSEVILFI
jgi:hypothetical protein